MIHMATEVLPDDRALRSGRRERALAQMAAHDLDVLVLGRQANVRYVAGAPQLWVAGTRPFGPTCVVVRETGAIHLLSTCDEGVPDDIPHENLYGIAWNPMNTISVLRDIEGAATAKRVGTDALSPGFAQLLPMAFPNAELLDGELAMRAARRIKTTDEVAALREAIRVAEKALAAAVAELRPGISEKTLTGVLLEAMTAGGVSTPLIQDAVWVTSRDHPWRRASEDGRVQPGDLVAFSAGVPITKDQWWERSPIFSALNTNKKGLTLDLLTSAGRDLLRRFIARSDVIAESFTPRVLDQIGVDFAAVQAVRPDAILLRMPGFGLDGPWRDNPAFAYVIEAASGVSWLTGYPDRNPCEPYSVGDPNAGVHALNALLLALEHRRRTGQGVLVEAAMVDAALNIAAEQVIEYSAYGAVLQRGGNRGPTAAPQNLYRTAVVDEFGLLDSWVAVAVATDEQWAGLCEALGRPQWALDPALSDAPGRRQHHDLIDEHPGAGCQRRSCDEIVGCLWDAGVPVAKVMQPHRQTELPQLRFRGFFEEVVHPVNEPVAHSTVPVRFSGGPNRFHVDPAPLLGQHNHELLAEIGLSEDEIAELEASGVIGRAPGGARKAHAG
jgi:crotonobetainyl-CoA:carnitine CoA-transferase CaiB-like acyl-CoA transferase